MHGHPEIKSDMKQGLTSRKPRLSLMSRSAQVYGARGLEYGCDKYVRGNYHRQSPEGLAPIERFAVYLDATLRHLTTVADAVNRAIGTGDDVVAACRTPDREASGSFPASGLPHMSHAAASLALAITVGVDLGLLEADPGCPWADAIAPRAVACPDSVVVYDAGRAGGLPVPRWFAELCTIAGSHNIDRDGLAALASNLDRIGGTALERIARLLGARPRGRSETDGAYRFDLREGLARRIVSMAVPS